MRLKRPAASTIPASAPQKPDDRGRFRFVCATCGRASAVAAGWREAGTRERTCFAALRSFIHRDTLLLREWAESNTKIHARNATITPACQRAARELFEGRLARLAHEQIGLIVGVNGRRCRALIDGVNGARHVALMEEDRRRRAGGSYKSTHKIPW